jgi:hypothetical protein
VVSGFSRTFLQTVDGRDVRVVQRGEHFGFALKAREAIGIACHRGRQHLDCNLTLQIRVGGPIDLPPDRSTLSDTGRDDNRLTRPLLSGKVEA